LAVTDWRLRRWRLWFLALKTATQFALLVNLKTILSSLSAIFDTISILSADDFKMEQRCRRYRMRAKSGFKIRILFGISSLRFHGSEESLARISALSSPRGSFNFNSPFDMKTPRCGVSIFKGKF